MQATRSLLRRCGSAALALLLSTTLSRAMFMPPQATPVDRLLKQAEAYVAEHPNDPSGLYTLARIHYLAFHVKHDEVPAFPDRGAEAGKPPQLAAQFMVDWRVRRNGSDKIPGRELNQEELIDHAAKALEGFGQTLEANSKDGLAWLGKASLTEEFLKWKDQARPTKLPPTLDRLALADVRVFYGHAFEIALPADVKLRSQPVSGLQSLTSYEAAEALIRLAKDGELTAAEQKQADEARDALEKLGKIPMGGITPIVLALHSVTQIDELLAPETTVDFDLRGYGPKQRWPWIKPDLGLLVWDPLQTGEIRSARQLFGGYSFEIPRADGYAALAALDDNHDGVLSGAELDGLSVWFDRSSDGVSTRDEVTPLQKLGVQSLSVRADGRDGIHLRSSHGVTFRDGRTLPTWDWMVTPMEDSRVAPHEAP